MIALALIIVALVIGLALYFTPTIKAVSVGHPDQIPIFVLNLMLGWLFIPWVIALVWAYKGNHGPKKQVVGEPPAQIWYRKCPYCAEEVLAEAIKCKHCFSELVPIGPSI